MFDADDQARQDLKTSIVREAVKLSPNRLQVHVAARYRSVNTSFIVSRAMGARAADLVSGYADAVMFGVLEKYEEGLAALLDARLASLAKGYADRAAESGEGGTPYAELAGDIERMRGALKNWGDEGRPDWRFRNPWPPMPMHSTSNFGA